MLEYADFELLTVELLFVGAIVAIGSHYLRVPHTVALVVAGFGISFLDLFEVSLSPELVFLVFLPPVLFDAAINMDIRELARRWDQVAVLALVGTLITAGVVAGVLSALTGMPLKYAVLLAVTMAPTDPVSVLATMKEQGVSGGLRTLLEGESIFNDALGIVLFTIALEFAFPTRAGTAPTWWHALAEFGMEIGVGVAVGAVAGYFVHRLMRLLNDRLVEITLSVALSFGTFLIADRLGGSGILAVVIGGLLVGNYGTRRAMSLASEASLLEFWEVNAFLVNSALFLLLGLQFDAASLGEHATFIATAVSVLALFVGRGVATYGLLKLTSWLPRSAPIATGWTHAVFWGGLRGSIPIALVLGLTTTQRKLGEVDAVAVVFGTVLASLLIQGLTFAPLLARLHLGNAADEPPRQVASI